MPPSRTIVLGKEGYEEKNLADAKDGDISITGGKRRITRDLYISGKLD